MVYDGGMIGYDGGFGIGRRADTVWVGGREIRVSRATGEPCPVCGEPNGNCAGELGPPDHIAGFNEIESLVGTQTFLVEEDIWEEKQITPFTKTKVLKYPAGKHIPLEEARNLGLA